MATLLIFEFESNGPCGEEMANSFKELAFDIANEHGLKWKVWTEAPDQASRVAYIYLRTQNAHKLILKNTPPA